MILDPPSILITDDDRAFRETLREVFEPRGFRTLLAADGAEAVDIVRHDEIHIVLLDMHMPRLTGLEAIQQIHEIHAESPCILMSSALEPWIVDEAKQADVFAVQPKPVSFQEITSLVSQALRQVYDWPGAN